MALVVISDPGGNTDWWSQLFKAEWVRGVDVVESAGVNRHDVSKALSYDLCADGTSPLFSLEHIGQARYTPRYYGEEQFSNLISGRGVSEDNLVEDLCLAANYLHNMPRRYEPEAHFSGMRMIVPSGISEMAHRAWRRAQPGLVMPLAYAVDWHLPARTWYLAAHYDEDRAGLRPFLKVHVDAGSSVVSGLNPQAIVRVVN